MKTAVVGGNGQLGSDVVRVFAKNGHEVYPLTHRDIEICKIDCVSDVLRQLRPDIVVNTAAMHQVEACERDPEAAFAANALGPRNIAMVANDLGALVMHISTDYVFDGSKKAPYEETDAPAPLNVYGNTKLAGESFVRCSTPRHFVLRTSALYGSQPCRGKGGLNFVELMLKLGRERGKVRVVNGEIVSPTPTAELAEQIVRLSGCEEFGLFHATSEGCCSWYDFAKEIFRLGAVPANVEVALPHEFPSKVARPHYSVLENAALKAIDLNRMHPWQEGLRSYLSGAGGAAITGSIDRD